MWDYYLSSPPCYNFFADSSAPNRTAHERTIKFPSYALTLALLIIGASFMAASIFLPWSETFLAYGFLLWSPLLDLGRLAVTLNSFWAVSITARAAAILGWTGVILCSYVKTRRLSYAVLLVSSILSFVAFGVFTSSGLMLSWGAYLIMVGGILIAFTVVSKKIGLEIILESEKDKEESSVNQS